MCTNYRPTSRDWLAQQLRGATVEFDYPDEAYPGYAAPVLRRSSRDVNPDLAGVSAAAFDCLKACFGLIPFWAKDTKIGRMTYNARSETAPEKPAFRQAWSRRQWCLVPMVCFYEPSYETGRAVRWRIERGDGAPFMVAGLWDRWVAPGSGETVFSFSMLTLNAEAHPLMRRFHRPCEEKRSVAVVRSSHCEEWLAATPDAAVALLQPPDVDEFTSREESALPRRSATRAVPT
ncbi:MAG: SOS response-associated peptidase family protein [Burkholderiaceae bacterium]